MNKQSNSYIVTYATLLVVVVAAVLAFAAIKLQPLQNRNAEIEKIGAILGTIGRGTDTKELARDKAGYLEAQYEKYITDSFLVDAEGNRVEGDAFAMLDNISGIFYATEDNRRLPVFTAQSDEGRTQYIVPVSGSGLWGPLWGYIALQDDANTIEGIVFDHKGETPGLGAEIATPDFARQFEGKELFNDKGEFVSVDLWKGNADNNPHAVDAVSGGTLTSNGVKAMLKDCLQDYVPFFKKVQAGQDSSPAVPAAEETAEAEAEAPVTEGGDN